MAPPVVTFKMDFWGDFDLAGFEAAVDVTVMAELEELFLKVILIGGLARPGDELGPGLVFMRSGLAMAEDFLDALVFFLFFFFLGAVPGGQ